MIRLCAILMLLFTATLQAAEDSTNAPVELIILQGAPGEKPFEDTFKNQTRQWMSAATNGQRRFQAFSPETSGTNELAEFTAFLARQPTNSANELWIVLIGHGTFDGLDAKFNFTGPDLSAEQFDQLLAPFTRPLIILNTASSSAPFLKKLSRENRIIVTATKSGWEENFTRFGQYLAKSVVDPAADLDKDGQVSILEAFIFASRLTQDFYKEENRLATEHALLDDNGDGLGTPADFFRGIRAVKNAQENALPDGVHAHQLNFIRGTEEQKLSPEVREKRNALETQLEEFRLQKPQMSEGDYLKAIEPILAQIARLYHPATNSPTAPEAPKTNAPPVIELEPAKKIELAPPPKS